MQYKVTNNGEARTVDFLAVFAEGETKTFTETEIESWGRMGGVPPVNLLPEGFEMEYVSGPKTEGEVA
jgi:hypothetical protein